MHPDVDVALNAISPISTLMARAMALDFATALARKPGRTKNATLRALARDGSAAWLRNRAGLRVARA